MFQADLSPSWGFPHAPKQAGSSSHELSTSPSEPFANVKTTLSTAPSEPFWQNCPLQITILQIPKNKTFLIDIEESGEDTCKEGGGQVSVFLFLSIFLPVPVCFTLRDSFREGKGVCNTYVLV